MTKLLLRLLIPFVSFIDLSEVLERFGFVYKKSLVFRVYTSSLGDAVKWAEYVDYTHDGKPMRFKVKDIKTGCFFKGKVRIWGQL